MTGEAYEGVTLEPLKVCPEPFVGVSGGEYAEIYETCLELNRRAIERVNLFESWAALEIETQNSVKGAEHEH